MWGIVRVKIFAPRASLQLVLADSTTIATTIFFFAVAVQIRDYSALQRTHGKNYCNQSRSHALNFLVFLCIDKGVGLFCWNPMVDHCDPREAGLCDLMALA